MDSIGVEHNAPFSKHLSIALLLISSRRSADFSLSMRGVRFLFLGAKKEYRVSIEERESSDSVFRRV